MLIQLYKFAQSLKVNSLSFLVAKDNDEHPIPSILSQTKRKINRKLGDEYKKHLKKEEQREHLLNGLFNVPTIEKVLIFYKLHSDKFFKNQDELDSFDNDEEFEKNFLKSFRKLNCLSAHDRLN